MFLLAFLVWLGPHSLIILHNVEPNHPHLVSLEEDFVNKLNQIVELAFLHLFYIFNEVLKLWLLLRIHFYDLLLCLLQIGSN